MCSSARNFLPRKIYDCYSIASFGIRNFIVVVLIFLPFSNSYATHSAGADLQYVWISGRTYQVTATFYRDCAGVAAPSSITLNTRSASCSQNRNYTLNLVSGSGQEITFPCYTVNTKCNSSGSAYIGYQKYTYTNSVTLPQSCNDWLLSFYICCRNCGITTLNNPCNDNMYIEAMLNNVAAPDNSSPRFTNVPVAFLCTNQNSTYNHGVIDQNGDSLVYSFIAPKTYNTSTSSTGTVTFNPGYSAGQPLTSSPPVAINPSNGDITAFPTVNSEVGVAAILIREYRNGVVIGSVMRDMQFITKICNPNLLPSASGMNGSAIFDTTICPGNAISFTVNSSDPNAADTVIMSWNNAISGATFTTSSSLNPVGTFSWTTAAADARNQPYLFTVTVRDNACPTNGSQTIGFTIRVPLVTAAASSPSFNGFNVACRGASTGNATVNGNGGRTPYSYNWNPSGQTTQTATALSQGNYIVTVSDASGCTSTTSITLDEPASSVNISLSSSADVSCNGGNDGTATVSGSGGVGAVSYLWSPGGQTTATATGLSAIAYTVTATDLNGCTAQQIVSISQPALLSAVIDSFQNVTCQGNANGKIHTGVSGGTTPYSHRWSNGDTTASVYNLAPGTYSDTVRDAEGCTSIISHTITEPGSPVSIPSSSLSSSNVTCFGLSNGSANVSPSGGTLPYTVTWSNGDIGNSADTLSAGIYSVQIVDGNGCTFDSSILITEPAILSSVFSDISIAPSGTNISCNGDTTGTAKAVPSGGTLPYSFSWSNGSVADSIFNVSAGAYIVDVVDSNGCAFSDTVLLSEPSALNDSLRIKNVGCKGESSGGIRALPFGGAQPYTFTWSHGAFVSDTVGDLAAGFYQVTISDTNGCLKTDTVTIQEPSVIVPLLLPSSFIGAVNVACHGDSTGSATINVDGGTRPFTYNWSQGGVDSFVTSLSAGPVSVLVIDSNGCSIRRDTVLSQPPAFNYGQVIQSPLCYSESSGYIALHAAGSVGPYTYSWSNGGTTDSIGGLSAGTFSVIVYDANSCPDSLGFILTDPDTMTTHAAISHYNGFSLRCDGDSSGYIALHVTGGTGTYTYQWSTLQTTDSISALSGGNYLVTIFDSNNCRKDTSFLLSYPPAVVPNISLSVYSGGRNVSCHNFIDGKAITAATGGIPPYQYAWSNGDLADSAVGLGAGSHLLAITDSNGCHNIFSFTLTEPTPLIINPVISNYNGYSVACAGDSTGCITINASGGMAPYIHIWEFQDSISATTICNLAADTLSVRVVDINGCQLDTSFIITEPPMLNSASFLPNFGGYEIQCNGLANGSIDLNVTGGVSPFSFVWSTTDTTEDLSALTPGIYMVTITDANNCTYSSTDTIAEPPPLSSVINSTDASCSQSNGTADVFVSGGIPPFQYLWNNGDNASFADSLPGGYAIVNFSDQYGCNGVDSIVVNQLPGLLTSLVDITHISCNGNNDGSVTVAPVSGGSSPYSYIWSNGDNGFMADSLSAGQVDITVSDASGCSLILSAVIIDPSPLTLSMNVADVSCTGENDGSAIVLVNGGTYPYSYDWSPNVSSDSVASNITEGNYMLIVTDVNGCISSNSFSVEGNECELELPSAFSPNGDGFNDYYVVHGLNKYPENSLKVFNRWGNEVFSSTNYSNSEWYGQNSNGEELPEATYYVVFESAIGGVSKYTFVDLRK